MYVCYSTDICNANPFLKTFAKNLRCLRWVRRPHSKYLNPLA